MTGWLLDTNVLSELRRPKPARKVVAFVSAQPLDLLYISVVTLAEIRFGIELAAEATHRATLKDWLAQGTPDVRRPGPPHQRRRHAKMAAVGRGGPQGGLHLLATLIFFILIQFHNDLVLSMGEFRCRFCRPRRSTPCRRGVALIASHLFGTNELLVLEAPPAFLMIATTMAWTRAENEGLYHLAHVTIVMTGHT